MNRDRRGGDRRRGGGPLGPGGPLGLLIGAVGQGVGMAAEYHQHRKQKKEQLAAQEDQQTAAGPSSAPTQTEYLNREIADNEMNEFPPAYAESAQQASEQTLTRGQRPASDDKKQGSSQYDDDDSMSEDEDLDRDLIQADEEDWALDEAQPPTYEESEQGDRSTDGLVRDVLNVNAAFVSRQNLMERTPLPFPVIIPQRRPGSKGRGFIRAYAPVLNDCGIGQDTFLAFLKKFHQSSQASPIFPIIQVSCMIAGFAPSVIAMAVTTVVSAAAGVGAEVQSRQRTNNFLDRMNQELFQPAGLFALIMKYKPETETNAPSSIFNMFTAQQADLSTNQMIAKYGRNLIDGSKNSRGQKFRLGDGVTRGAIALPESAPLIFPELESTIVANGSKETFKDKTRDAKKFIANYMDRRAQTKYASEDPDSGLVVPVDGNKSKSAWANPDHAMYKGGLIGLVSGGKLSGGDRRRGGFIGQVAQARSQSFDNRNYNNNNSPAPYGREQALYDRRDRDIERYERYIDQGRGLDDRRYARYERLVADREWREQQNSSSSGAPYGQDPGRPTYNTARQQGRQRGGGIRRLMKQDVMYLMIVNLPSEAELAEARRQLQQR